VRTAMIGRIAATMARVPMVYHAHSPTSRNTTHRFTNWINARVERLSLRGISRVIAVSGALAEHMWHEGFDPARITVVPNGVPTLTNLPNRDKPRGTWTLGTAGLFRPRKGIEILLDAMAMLRRQGVAVKLLAIGAFESPDYARQIAACIERLGLVEHVAWTGFTTDVTQELLKTDLFVLPSLFGEGLPMVVLEAMAAGVPVVATKVPGLSEVIRDGRDGLLAASGDAVDLSEAIGAVIRGKFDWSAMRASALARHAAHFSDRAMASGVAAVYNEVLGRDHPSD
jgi:glycosyltransferase involved in cell wall biosynthesis